MIYEDIPISRWGYLTLVARPVSGQTRSRCTAGRSPSGCPQASSMWVSSGLRPARHRDEAWLEGLPCSQQHCPARRPHRFEHRREQHMKRAVLGGRSPQAVSNDQVAYGHERKLGQDGCPPTGPGIRRSACMSRRSRSGRGRSKAPTIRAEVPCRESPPQHPRRFRAPRGTGG